MNGISHISFSNFRRFKSLKPIEFGQINYLVGRNNSGKSTLVKAALLFQNYLKHSLGRTFPFDGKILEDTNIVTFDRAAHKGDLSKPVNIAVALDDVVFRVELFGELGKTRANVAELRVTDHTGSILLILNFIKNQVMFMETQAGFHSNKMDILLDREKEGIDKLKIELKALEVGSAKYYSLNQEIDKRESKLEKLKISIKESKENLYQSAVTFDDEKYFSLNKVEKTDFKQLFSLIEDAVALKLVDLKSARKTKKNDATIGGLEGFEDGRNNYKKWFEKIHTSISNLNFSYIGSSTKKQSALFLVKDFENNLAQSIHSFEQGRILKGTESYLFILRWMKVFEIGDDFEIISHTSDGYELKIYKDGDSNHLADKGMGSLQAMNLILRLAVLINEHLSTGKIFSVLVEEPELNLHPALQSQLTDLFHEVSHKYAFQFVIETHSEYLIRKSQLLGLEKQYFGNQTLNTNPFKVFYFTLDDGPYEMKYTAQGRFDRDFNEGFYDEASRINLKAIKLARK
jgi:predicted ATP-dependent endonuclease of OLD family